MDIRHLRAFVTVAGTLNFRKAADQLCMTQPPLSHAIKSLEEELGVLLLNREQKKNVQLTVAGKKFLVAAQRILHDVERAKTMAKLSVEGHFGSLSIGFTDDFIFGTLPDLFNDFSLEYPNARLFISQDKSYQLIDRLNLNEFDCIFTTQPSQKISSNLKVSKWAETPIVVVVPNNHKLAGESEISLSQLSDERFLMDVHSLRSRFDDQICKLLINAGISPENNIEVNDTMMCYELVHRGYGVVLASLDSTPFREGHNKVIKLKDDGAKLERVLICRKDNNSSVLERFLEMTNKYNKKSD